MVVWDKKGVWCHQKSSFRHVTKHAIISSVSFFGLISMANKANGNAACRVFHKFYCCTHWCHLTGVFLTVICLVKADSGLWVSTKCLKTLVLCESHQCVVYDGESTMQWGSRPALLCVSSSSILQTDLLFYSRYEKQVRANMPLSENGCSNLDLTANWMSSHKTSLQTPKSSPHVLHCS